MAPDAAASDALSDCEAMASVDRGELDQLIIALTCCDDAWLSAPLGDAVALTDWR